MYQDFFKMLFFREKSPDKAVSIGDEKRKKNRLEKLRNRKKN
jgi:hypothetical protein